MPDVAPYGSWSSPITPQSLVEATVGLSFPLAVGDRRYWLESRPSEQGRVVIVERDESGTVEDAIPPGFSVRTLVHEYGGRCSTVVGRTIIFSNFEDQRLYRVDPGAAPVPITPEPPRPRSIRYADPVVTPDGRSIICVRERHLEHSVENDLVRLATDGSGEPEVLAEGHDFFAAPAIDGVGGRCAFLAWDHPAMPWDATVLLEGTLDASGLGPLRIVAGGAAESVAEPRYAPDGSLHFVSDRTGWWNCYRDEPGGPRRLVARDAEFTGPAWTFGNSMSAFLADDTMVCAWSDNGTSHLGVLATQDDDGEPVLREVITPFTHLHHLSPAGGGVLAIAGAAGLAPAVVEIDPADGSVTVLRRSSEVEIDPDVCSVPEAITYPTSGDRVAHALYYRPVNPGYVAPAGELPPLVVMSHGGPTSQVSSVLNSQIQFFTTRGLAVVDVNYGGSSGYGRAYREQLKGTWGIVDVDDCISAAQFLVDRGDVDGERLVIRGGSAGGYTTLCACTFRKVFAAGASYFGVADAGALARETHKFESRYLDGLIGPWPDARARYEERSPIFHVDQISTPMILLQGLEDAVVPPAQAEEMAAALERLGLPYALIEFPSEQHGFRRAANIVRAATAELLFYAAVLGFAPAGELEPIEIHNRDAIKPRA
jgi:dipeptidyl aminopeptidase/acylaminoacyl peptidase